MSNHLYTTEVLRLASSLGEPRPLQREDGVADVRSPTCGSRVRAKVQLGDDRRIERISLEVHACAFGQASAALVEKHSSGKDHNDIAQALLSLSGWLAGQNDVAGWTGMELLEPARSRASRHPAILLPFRALLAAIETAP